MDTLRILLLELSMNKKLKLKFKLSWWRLPRNRKLQAFKLFKISQITNELISNVVVYE